MNDLFGHAITKVELNDADTIIVFTDSTGKQFIFRAEGDCCSESWFSSINGLKNLVNNRGWSVTEVQERPEIDGLLSTRQDVDVLYGYFLTTINGTCEIEFRNASNGYYGGSCEPIASVDQATLREITTDF